MKRLINSRLILALALPILTWWLMMLLFFPDDQGVTVGLTFGYIFGFIQGYIFRHGGIKLG